jgi:hypothetical protein
MGFVNTTFLYAISSTSSMSVVASFETALQYANTTQNSRSLSARYLVCNQASAGEMAATHLDDTTHDGRQSALQADLCEEQLAYTDSANTKNI